MIPANASAANKPHARAGETELPGLMLRYQQADPAAVDELVAKLSPPLQRFFSAFGINRADMEDLVQECWIRIHRARHTYRWPEPVLPWIFAIARHTRLDAYRRRRRRDRREVLVPDPPETATASIGSAMGEGDELWRSLAELSESQREVILMLKVSDMSLEEVARATSCTVGSVKQKAHRGYSKLREILARERR